MGLCYADEMSTTVSPGTVTHHRVLSPFPMGCRRTRHGSGEAHGTSTHMPAGKPHSQQVLDVVLAKAWCRLDIHDAM